MYIWTSLDTILVYSLEEDNWSTLNPPPSYASDNACRGLGSWQGRICTVNCDGNATMWANAYDEDEWIPPLLWVWELVGQCEETHWKKIAEMPSDMHKWLIPLRVHEWDLDLEVHASFCDEHMLIYSWVPPKGRAYRFVLYDLATKTWAKVEVPNHSVSILPDKERDTKRWDSGGPYKVEVADDFLMAAMMGRGDSFAMVMHDCLKKLYRGIGETTYDSDRDDSLEEH